MANYSNHLVAVSLTLGLAACAAVPAAKTAVEAPTMPPAAARATASTFEAAPNAEHGSDDAAALLALLPTTKIELAEGIAQVETRGACALSAKFELEDGKLSLSVYTAKNGIEPDAEHNVLSELSGDPTQATWKPKEEVFADAKHLTRASYHLTLVQRSKLTLAAVIVKALAKQPGRVYSIEPAIHERSPIFHVLVATPEGGHVNVDVESGA